MSTEAKMVEYRRQLAALEARRRDPSKSKLRPRDMIRIRFRNLASNGLIPGVKKASW
jgi:ribosomal protein S14